MTAIATPPFCMASQIVDARFHRDPLFRVSCLWKWQHSYGCQGVTRLVQNLYWKLRPNKGPLFFLPCSKRRRQFLFIFIKVLSFWRWNNCALREIKFRKSKYYCFRMKCERFRRYNVSSKRHFIDEGMIILKTSVLILEVIWKARIFPAYIWRLKYQLIMYFIDCSVI